MFSKARSTIIVSTLLLCSLMVPTMSVSAAVASNSESIETSNMKNDLGESQSFSLEELMDESGLSYSEKAALTNEVLDSIKEQARTGIMLRSRYYTIHQDLSNAQVKKVVNSADSISTLKKIIPNKAIQAVVGAIYSNYYSMYRTAASKGWGIRITITSDSYNPTSTGTTFNVSYLK